MKRLFFIVTAAALAIAIALGGCTNQNQSNGSQGSSDGTSMYTAPGSFPIVNEPIELRMFSTPPAHITDLATNTFTKWYEEKTNIKIIFETTTPDARAEKINLIMASGDLPDFFYRVGYDIDWERYGGEEGLLLDLTDLIQEQMPVYRKVLQDYPILEGAMRSTDGKVYATGSLGGCYHCYFACKMWVNTMWLDRMGETAPTTTDEFYKLLKKYKEFNPNGIGISGATDNWLTNPADFIMNAFIYNNAYSPTRTYLKAGKTVATIVDTDEYKEGLMFLNKLYSEGLMDEGALTQNADANRTVLASEGEPVLFQPGGGSINWIDSIVQADLYRNYYPISPLEGPKGVRQTTYFYPYIETGAGISVSAKSKYPEAAVRWVDWMYSIEGYLTTTYGKEGVDWAWPTEEDKAMDGGTPLFTQIRPYNQEPQNDHWQDFVVGHSPWHSMGTAPQDIDIFDPIGLEPLLFKSSRELYEPFIPADGTVSMVPVTLKPDESAEIQTITTELENLIGSARDEFIVGIRSFDDWDAYVKSLHDIGLEKYIATYQKAYDRQYK